MRGLRAAAAAVLASAVLGACVVAPLGYYDGYGEPIAYANVPPPAPYYEVQPALPFVGAIWISGFWGWGGGRHVWVPGRWEHPRAGYAWQPHRWVPQGGRWALSGGGWVRGR
jgi:WXXGXW repeat (2 copies)